MAVVPDLMTVRDWLQVSPLDISDGQLQGVLDAEIAQQLIWCNWSGDYPAPLAQGLLARCAWTVAARGVPLGTLPPGMTGNGAEFGATLLPRWNAVIERLEGPYRHVVVA